MTDLQVMMDDVPEDCSTFLMEEIEIEMMEEEMASTVTMTPGGSPVTGTITGTVTMTPGGSPVTSRVTMTPGGSPTTGTVTMTPGGSPIGDAPDLCQEEIVCLDDTPCSDGLNSLNCLNSDSKDFESEPVSLVCKWTNCDWPGSYDDLVDHIREIHVDLQPYHSLPSPKKNHSLSSLKNQSLPSLKKNGLSSRWVSSRWVSSCSSSSASTSSDDNPASVPSTSSDDNPASVPSTSSDDNPASVPSTFSDDTRSPPAPSTFRTKPVFSVHIDTSDKYYVCLWEGCKVYGVRSQKRSWLDRHVLQHSGDKPFKCIVEKCGSRFKTQSALERHVNSHFNATKETCLNSDGSSEHGSDDLSPRTAMMRAKTCTLNGGSNSGTPSKLVKKKKGPRLRKVSRGFSEDFFDTSIMDQIQIRLFHFNQTLGSHITDSLRHLTLHSRVMAKRRVEGTGECHILLRWHPSNILPDEWIPEAMMESKRTVKVPFNKLPPEYSMSHLNRSPETDDRNRRRRK